MSDSARGVFARIRWPRPFAGLRGVTPADVPREVSAGVTLAALMIPLNIGYAQVAGLVVYRFGAPLYFANATLFLEEIEQLVNRAPIPVRWFVLDAEAMVDVDTTGAAVLRQAIDLLARRKITFAISRADRAFRSWLEKYELMTLIDQKHFYPTNRQVAAAFREDQARVGGGA